MKVSKDKERRVVKEKNIVTKLFDTKCVGIYVLPIYTYIYTLHWLENNKSYFDNL